MVFCRDPLMGLVARHRIEPVGERRPGPQTEATKSERRQHVRVVSLLFHFKHLIATPKLALWFLSTFLPVRLAAAAAAAALLLLVLHDIFVHGRGTSTAPSSIITHR